MRSGIEQSPFDADLLVVNAVQTIHARLSALPKREGGQTMAEYATVLSVITILCLTAFVLLGAAVTGAIARVAGYFS